MTESAAKKERFIELRASGMTLAQAAGELDIAYNTAVNWQKEVLEAETDIPEFMSEEEIENIRRDWKILDANKERRREERDKMLNHL
jgi:hypothetical protein